MDSNWKNRFEHAEVTPSDALWSNIEAGLNTGTSARPWIFTTVGIAASAALLFAASIMTYWFANNQNAIEMDTSTEIVETQTPTSQETQNQTPESTAIAETESSKPVTQQVTIESENPASDFSNAADPTPAQPVSSGQVAQSFSPQESAPLNESTQDIEPIESMESIAFVDQNQQVSVDSVKSLQNIAEVKHEPFEKLPTIGDLIKKKEKKSSSSRNRLWAGVFQGVGNYASNISSSSVAASLSDSEGGSFNLSNALASEQSSTRSIDEKQVLNTTILVGVPMSQKLSLVSGMQYSRSSFESTAGSFDNQLLHFTSESRDIANTTSGTFTRTDLSGFYEMASVPVMVDYQILSSQINWSVQAGPSLGLMLRQKIVSDDLGLSQTTQPGDLYKPMHLRMVVGTNFSYSLNEHYQVSIRPAAEQAITSITNSSASFSSRPFNYTISLGLRYQF